MRTTLCHFSRPPTQNVYVFPPFPHPLSHHSNSTAVGESPHPPLLSPFSRFPRMDRESSVPLPSSPRHERFQRRRAAKARADYRLEVETAADIVEITRRSRKFSGSNYGSVVQFHNDLCRGGVSGYLHWQQHGEFPRGDDGLVVEETPNLGGEFPPLRSPKAVSKLSTKHARSRKRSTSAPSAIMAKSTASAPSPVRGRRTHRPAFVKANNAITGKSTITMRALFATACFERLRLRRGTSIPT